mmetsp:Transcript_28223/g.67940  ORF Transcript_28223/g.67940 Transcript_28223/m.67940 type:complete len:622 (+) Transcript_28223:356-2221(+)
MHQYTSFRRNTSVSLVTRSAPIIGPSRTRITAVITSPLSMLLPRVVSSTGTRRGPVAILVRSSLGRRPMTSAAAIPLLRLQHPPNPLVHRFQLAQIRTGDLDRVSGDGQDDDVLPGMKLILVLDHLRALPIVLNSGALEGELFYLDRYGTTSLRFDYGNIIFRLAPIHVHHPRLRDDPPDNHILGFPILRRIGRPRVLRIVLDHVLPLGHHHRRLGDVEQQGQRARSLLDQTGRLLGILDVYPVHLQEDVTELHPRGSRRGSLDDERDHGPLVQHVHELFVRLQEEAVDELLGFEEHDAERGREDFGIVPLAAGGELPLLTALAAGRGGLGGARGLGTPGRAIFLISRGLQSRAEEDVVLAGHGTRGGRRGRGGNGGGSEAHLGPRIVRRCRPRRGGPAGGRARGMYGGGGSHGRRAWRRVNGGAGAEDAERIVPGERRARHHRAGPWLRGGAPRIGGEQRGGGGGGREGIHRGGIGLRRRPQCRRGAEGVGAGRGRSARPSEGIGVDHLLLLLLLLLLGRGGAELRRRAKRVGRPPRRSGGWGWGSQSVRIRLHAARHQCPRHGVGGWIGGWRAASSLRQLLHRRGDESVVAGSLRGGHAPAAAHAETSRHAVGGHHHAP